MYLTSDPQTEGSNPGAALGGKYPDQVFSSRCRHACTTLITKLIEPKQPNLKLKTFPKQLLDNVQLVSRN
jgi:hypothetical protein